MGASSSMGKALTNNQDEVKKREERIAALEQQLKESTARYDKLFIANSGGISGTTTQYKVNKKGKRISDIKTIPTSKSSGSTGTNLKIQGTATNLG